MTTVVVAGQHARLARSVPRDPDVDRRTPCARLSLTGRHGWLASCTPTSAMALPASGDEFRAHEWVDHAAGEYVRGRRVTTNQRRGLLLPAQAVDRRHPPPRQHEAPGPLPGRVRLPLLDIARSATRSARGVVLGRVGGKRLTYKPLRNGAEHRASGHKATHGRHTDVYHAERALLCYSGDTRGLDQTALSL